MICSGTYTGQTCTCYRIRWTGHRTLWLNPKPVSDADGTTDETALLDHYRIHHPTELAMMQADTLTRGFDRAYEVTFVDSCTGSLDNLEDRWKHKIGSSINRSIIVTPAIIR